MHDAESAFDCLLMAIGLIALICALCYFTG